MGLSVHGKLAPRAKRVLWVRARAFGVPFAHIILMFVLRISVNAAQICSIQICLLVRFLWERKENEQPIL